MNILLTAIGKRVQLIQHLKQNFSVVGVDPSREIAARQFADYFETVPKYNEAGYITRLLEISEKYHVSMIIPLYEKEFDILNEYRDLFENKGIKLLLSSGEVIGICNNKKNTALFFKKNGILSPKIYDLQNKQEIIYPVIIKPWDGMGSHNVFKAKNEKELDFFAEYVPNAMVQQCVEGKEYTVDVLCDFYGNIISIVPRQRLEVRAGEVVKSRVTKQPDIIEKVRFLIERLKKEGNVMGPVTVQCFVTEQDEIFFIEINPRFGGGVPLTMEAGVNYGMYFKRMLLGDKISYFDDYKELTMIRYDQAVYV
ncbi:MAG: Carbamoyl-phosphate synthase large chain [Lachnoclostridium sp.]|jgi:carbamoyl-phosphate synthase large subunit